MNINAYVYINSGARTLCFECAVKEILAGVSEEFDLALETGHTENGNDMRSTPTCDVCNKRFQDFCIA